MKLTEENYFSREANLEYMSVSQYKSFLECEEGALAKLNGFEDESKECMIVSSYVHAAIEGEEALEKFRKKNPSIFSTRGETKGELKSNYKHAEKMVEVLMNDDICKQMLQGEKEIIVTAELFGVKWKCKIDVLAEDQGRISDIKAIKSIYETYWMPQEGRRVSFIEKYNYVLQMAVYSKVESVYNKRFEALEPFIVAVSKESEPDKEIICFDENSLNYELEKLQANLPRVMAVKEGFEEPKRCGNCKYCRQTKKAKIVHYQNIMEVGV